MALGVALALIATVAFGAGDVLARKAINTLSPGAVLIVTVSASIVAVGVIGVVIVGFEPYFNQSATFYGLTALMGLLAYVSGNLFYFHALKRAGVTLAAPLIGAGPLFAILLAVVIGGERPNAMTLLGAFVIVLGVVVLVSERRRVTR